MNYSLRDFYFLLWLPVLFILFPSADGKSREAISAPQALTAIPWIENNGQWPRQVRFVARILTGQMYLTRNGELFYEFTTDNNRKRFVLKEAFLGTHRPQIKGLHHAPTKTHFFKGCHPGGWTRKVATYRDILMSEVWPGISVRLIARGRNVEKVFIVEPHRSPEQIRLHLEGAQAMTSTPDGRLNVTTPAGKLTFSAPYAYQIIDGHTVEIPVKYQIISDTEYGFRLGTYNPDYQVIIDPLLAATYLGGDDWDQVMEMKQNAAGNLVVAGWTKSSDFPTQAGAYMTGAGAFDGFVAIISPDLSMVLSASYFGGVNDDFFNDLDLDPAGNVYLTGHTFSPDIPITAGAFATTFQGGADGFAAVFTSDLSTLSASTYLGGTADEYAQGIVFSTGEVFITGNTSSTDFPVTAAAYATTYNGGIDGFVSSFSTDLSTLTASTYVGGSDWDQPNDIKLLPGGDIVIGGWTQSTDLTQSLPGFDVSANGDFDGFLFALAHDLSSALGATYIGGSGLEHVEELLVTTSGEIFAVGWTTSPDYPVTAGAYDTTLDGGTDIIISTFSADLTLLTASTLLGGDVFDQAYAIATTSQGKIIVGGLSSSTDFPVSPGAVSSTHTGGGDAVLARLTSDLTQVEAATYYGGTDFDQVGPGLVVDAGDNIYFSGRTYSADLPVTSSAFDQSYGANFDGYIAYICLDSIPIPDFTADVTSGCAPLTVQFQNLSSGYPVSYQWLFQGGSPASSTTESPTVSFSSPGSYNVTLIVTNCAGSDTITKAGYITVQGLPIAGFTFTVSGGTVDFISTATNGTISWDFGDSNTSTQDNPTHTYTTAGTYNVIQTVTNPCGTATDTQQVTITFPPAADFTADTTSGCAPLTVQFTDLSTDGPTTWQWSFPGGSPATSTDQNPVVTYNTAGTYDVTLIVSGPNGADTITKANYIETSVGAPVSSFTAQLTNTTVTLTNTSTNATNYLWDFGDGNTSTQAHVLHTFAQPGIYTVTLIALNACGQDTSTTVVVIAGEPVHAAFAMSDTAGCAPLTIQFTDLSGPGPTSWQWMIWQNGGDTIISEMQNPVVDIQSGGTYHVRLIVANSQGVDTLSQMHALVVTEAVVADFSYSIDSLNIQLQDESAFADSIYWYLDGEMLGSETELTHHVNHYGTYEVMQVAFNTCGADTMVQQIPITQGLPLVSIHASDTVVCAPKSITFDVEIYNADSVRWVFPQGVPGTSTEMHPKVLFQNPGIYTIQLTAYNATDSLTVTKLIELDGEPSVDFSYTTFEKTASFIQTVTPNTQYSWDFGDGSTADTINPVHEYPFFGRYDVLLVATNACGTRLVQKEIMIRDTTTGVYYGITPNPGSGQYLLNVNMEFQDDVHLYFYTEWGQLLTDYHWENVTELRDEEIILPTKRSIPIYYYIEFGNVTASGILININP